MVVYSHFAGNLVILADQLSHSTTKNDLCAQRRLRSAWASAQSDQSSLYDVWVAKGPMLLYADSKYSD